VEKKWVNEKHPKLITNVELEDGGGWKGKRVTQLTYLGAVKSYVWYPEEQNVDYPGRRGVEMMGSKAGAVGREGVAPGRARKED